MILGGSGVVAAGDVAAPPGLPVVLAAACALAVGSDCVGAAVENRDLKRFAAILPATHQRNHHHGVR